MTYEEEKDRRHQRGKRLTMLGAAIMLACWLMMPPRVKGSRHEIDVDTLEIKVRATDVEGRLNAKLGIVFGSLVFVVGQLYRIDRD